MNIINIREQEYTGLCSCGCGGEATIADEMGQFATNQCRELFYSPVLWQLPDKNTAIEAAEYTFKKMKGV